jgi:hypothetical protein
VALSTLFDGRVGVHVWIAFHIHTIPPVADNPLFSNERLAAQRNPPPYKSIRRPHRERYDNLLVATGIDSSAAAVNVITETVRERTLMTALDTSLSDMHGEDRPQRLLRDGPRSCHSHNVLNGLDGEIRVVHVHIVAAATRHEEQAVGCAQCPIQFVIHSQPETGFSD